MKKGLGVFVIILALVMQASATIYCDYKGPDNSQDLMQVSNFQVSGPSDVKEGSNVDVEFDLKNNGQMPVNLTDKGVFAAVRDKDGDNKDFGYKSKNAVLNPGESVHFEDDFKIDEKGLWNIWPSYEYWKQTYSQPLQQYVYLRTKGPDYWHACELTVCPDYCDNGIFYSDAYIGQDNGCVYDEEECEYGCDGDECAAGPPDLDAPVVAVSHAPDNATTEDSVSITANATDENLVEYIVIYADGAVARRCDYSQKQPYYKCTFSRTYGPGVHRYYAKAEDESGNQETTSTHTFSIAPPLLEITPHIPETEVTGTMAGGPSFDLGSFDHITEGPVMPGGVEDGDGDGIINMQDRCRHTRYSDRDKVFENGCLCFDNDGGLNYERSGTTRYWVTGESEPRVLNDRCSDSRHLIEYSCTSSEYGLQNYVDCEEEYGFGYICQSGMCLRPEYQICYSSAGSCADGIQNQGEDGIDCGGICPPCNQIYRETDLGPISSIKCGTGTKYAPPDSPCTLTYPTDTHKIELTWTNNQLEYPCQYIEVCHRDLDYIIEDALDCCSARADSTDPLCQEARHLSESSSAGTCKRCVGLYIIKGLGRYARWMREYRSIYHTSSRCPFDNASICIGGCVNGACAYTGVEQAPAEMLINDFRTGICRDYAEAVTTLLRKAGYSQQEVKNFCDGAHCYNLVKFPGDAKWHVVDTTGNTQDINFGTLPGGYNYCRNLDEDNWCFKVRTVNRRGDPSYYYTGPIADVAEYFSIGSGSYEYPMRDWGDCVKRWDCNDVCSGEAGACPSGISCLPECGPGVACYNDNYRIPDIGPTISQMYGCS
jgi:hypothetical protein